MKATTDGHGEIGSRLEPVTASTGRTQSSACSSSFALGASPDSFRQQESASNLRTLGRSVGAQAGF